MSEITIAEIGSALSRALSLKTRPLCVYGSDAVPDCGVMSASICSCVASSMYRIASGSIEGPVYVRYESGELFCRCMGGPAWFGYCPFDRRLMDLISTGSRNLDAAPKRLKVDESAACSTYSALGRIQAIGRYTVMSLCEDVDTDPGVRCIVIFGTAGQVRDLCALAHFRSPDIMGIISAPWGPACATLVTYPAGMAENIQPVQVFMGPTDPSSREWLPESDMAVGIPLEVARRIVEDCDKSFLSLTKP